MGGGRLDLSVEFYILLPKYADLFAREERVEARRRLELHEFYVDRAIAAHSVAEVRADDATTQTLGALREPHVRS